VTGGQHLGSAALVAASSQLPWVWSPWWWVLISVRTGALDTLSMAVRKARLRRSVKHVSMAVTPSAPTTKPVLLSPQLPSSCT
jgi:hypothetical protein